MKHSLILISLPFLLFSCSGKSKIKSESDPDKYPGEWMMRQRAYPNAEINYTAYSSARQQAKTMRMSYNKTAAADWEEAGPVNIGGRITDVEMHPSSQTVIWAGTATGGVFKSTDAGQNFSPVFDDAESISIGDLAIDPQDANTVYVGTGEANGGYNSGSFPGFGIYKTTNGGTSWTHLGLEATHQIARIIVDPENSNRVFAAAMGVQYGATQERGVYRSLDGGTNWNRVFFLNDTTGCIDLVIHPQNPDTLFAAMWTRRRYPWGRYYGGEDCGVYRSTDGGDNWIRLTNGLPPADPNTGRIGIAISASSPNIIYAAYTTDPILNVFDGLYKSTDNGNNWTRVDVSDLSNAFSNFGWYFGNVRVDPTNASKVYVVGFETHESTDGGQNFNNITNSIHVDHHALYIYPANTNLMVLGGDGGLYVSTNGGSSWNHNDDMPITQFYTCEIDHLAPTNLYGGTQDNNTIRTLTGDLNDWEGILGGDGFYVLVDPTDNNIIYAEYQWGNFFRSDDGGFNMTDAMNGIDVNNDRFNWNTPVAMDVTNPQTLYYGSNILYKTTNGASSWSPISMDLTNGPGPGNLNFGTITTIDVSVSNPSVIYAGTDDGNVWMTDNGGTNWTNLSSFFPDLWTTRVSIDPNDEQIAYVTFSGYGWGDYMPHVFKTINGGQSFNDITGNLPQGPVNDIIPDLYDTDILYVATDFGVFTTTDGGQTWSPMGTTIPLLPVTDLDYHNATRILVAATHGRSMYKYQLEAPVGIETVEENQFSVSVYPNPVKDVCILSFTLEKESKTEISVYDVSGKKVTTLANKNFAKGKNELRWNVGEKVETGVYLIYVISGEQMKTQKVIVK